MEKKSIGKGLASLMNINNLDGDNKNASEIPLAMIDPNPYQPRKHFDDEQITELSESIKKHGVLQSILLRKKDNDRYEIVAGERRFRASKLAGLVTIPAQVKDLTDIQTLEISLIENIQREDISTVETARAYKKLIEEFGHTQEQLAKAMGKSRSAVANCLRLLQLPEEILNMLSHKNITEGHARTILSVSEENQLPFAKQIISESLTVREAENMARLINNPIPDEEEIIEEDDTTKLKEKKETIDLTSDIKLIETNLKAYLNTKVTIAKKAKKGQIVIDFKSEEELSKIINIIIKTEE